MDRNENPRSGRGGRATAVCSDGRDPITAATLHDAVRAACAEVGIVDRDVPADGRWHKTDIDGDPRGRGDGRIKLFPDGEGGIVCNWKGETLPFFVDDGRKLNEDERRDRERKRAESIRLAQEEEARRHAEAASKGSAIWNASQPATSDHPYQIRKRIQPHGARLYRGPLVVAGMPCNDSLIVPACDGSGAIHTLQFIHPEKRDGDNKRFLPGGDLRGCCFSIGAIEGTGPLCLCEGYATGASIHEATGYPVAVSFNAGNLGPVAHSLRARFPNSRLVLCADDDAATDGNPGLTKAREAAQSVGGLLASPDFGEDRPVWATDLNDLHQLLGLEEVAECIRRQVEEATVRRLAALSPMDYDRVRQSEAEVLGVRVTTLDTEIEKLRRTLNAGAQPGSDGSGEAVLFPEVEPCTEPVDGAELLTDLAATCRRYVVLRKHADTAIALWVAFTHAIGSVEIAPYLALTSPEKRCGKSTVLALLRRLTRRPLPSANISASALFRAVEAWEPTLLIDEADAFIRNNEELRGILNSGHTRDLAFVIRNVAVGDDHEPRRFSTWAAKAIALIGKLPDTLADRSIEIPMQRKLPGERIERLRHVDPATLHNLASRCVRWAVDHAQKIRAARPSMPDGLHDRAQDNWEPLIAIADLAGSGWPKLARTAALALSGAVDSQSGNIRVQLLADIRSVFASKKRDRLPTVELIADLIDLEGHPWGEVNRGKPINPHWIAARLRAFGIVRGTKRSGGDTFKGYEIEQFADTFKRYLSPDDPPSDGSHGHNVDGARVAADYGKVTREECDRSENGLERSCGAACDRVTDREPPPWETRL